MCTVPRFVKLHPGAHIPTKATPHSVGYDIRLISDLVIPAGGAIVDVGLGVIPPDGHYGQLLSRSGLASKNGIVTYGGVIDPDYRGSVRVILHNHGADYPMHQGDAISQIVFLAYSPAVAACEISMSEFKELSTLRGERGFGSSTATQEAEPVKEPDCPWCNDAQAYEKTCLGNAHYKRQKTDNTDSLGMKEDANDFIADGGPSFHTSPDNCSCTMCKPIRIAQV